MPLNKRLWVALVLFAILAAIAWQTMEPGRMRMVVCVLLVFFALRSVLHWHRESHENVGRDG